MFRLGSDAQPSREDQQRWMVRDPSEGDILYFNSFETLHRWIVEREVDRSWEISRTGDKWKTLGDVGEFRPIFQVVDNVSSLEAENGPQPGTTEKAPEREARAKKDTLDQFDSQGGGTRTDSGGETAAQTPGSRAESSQSDTGEQFPVGQQSSADGGVPAPEAIEHRKSSEPAPAEEPTEPASSSAEVAPPAEEPTEPVSSSAEVAPADDDPTEPASSSAEIPPADDEPTEPASSSAEVAAPADPEPTGGGARNRQRSPSPTPSPAAESADQSDVRLDSDRFGSQPARGTEAESAGGPQDEWAFGDEEVGYEETTIREEDLDYDDGGRRWPTVAVGALVVAAGAAAYAWFFQRDLVDSWLAADSASQPVDIDESSGVESAGEAVAASRSQLAEVVATAADHAREEGIELFATVHAEADTVLVEAIGEATDEAEQKAEEEKTVSTVDLLAEAERALENGNADTARQTYHEIIDREPQNSEAITGLGWSLLNMGNTEAAIAQFEKALHHNPSYGDAYIGLGQANQAAGNAKQALEAYQKYLDRFPGGSKRSIAEYQSEKIRKSLGME